jgi:hypothetical protein
MKFGSACLGVASIALVFGLAVGKAEAVPVNLQVSGITDDTVASSVEPYLGASDSYSIDLSFDIGVDDVVTGLSGSAVINGHSTDIVGFGGSSSTGIIGRGFEFSFVPFGEGPGLGNMNLTYFVITLFSPSVDMNMGAPYFDLLTAADASVTRVRFVGTRHTEWGMNFAHVYDLDPQRGIDVISVPEPPTLAVFALGLGTLASMRLRRRRAARG